MEQFNRDCGGAGVGGSLSAEDEALAEDWRNQPNRARWLIWFMSEPQRIVDYMAANCTTEVLGGSNRQGWFEQLHFGFFTGDLVHDHIGQNDTFEVCKDSFGGYEKYHEYVIIPFVLLGELFWIVEL